MGISPLVFSEQESKDPKSVLVYVKKPGEELVEESSTNTASEEEQQSEIEPRSKTIARKTRSQGQTEAETKIETEPESLVKEEEPTVRRRRRRSSAVTEVEV